MKILFLSFTCEDIGVAMVANINFDFLEQKIQVLLFHNIFVTGILR